MNAVKGIRIYGNPNKQAQVDTQTLEELGKMQPTLSVFLLLLLLMVSVLSP